MCDSHRHLMRHLKTPWDIGKTNAKTGLRTLAWVESALLILLVTHFCDSVLITQHSTILWVCL